VARNGPAHNGTTTAWMETHNCDVVGLVLIESDFRDGWALQLP
jgi:hypothetical protein